MNITLRRVIAAIFFLFFIISAPLLILYTAGFRYNLKKSQLTKTGALVIDSEPSGAIVFLNDQKTKYKTPMRLNNILPDDYSVRIEKTDYYPWDKKLTVASQETTFAEDIILFKQSIPKIIAENISFIEFTSDKKSAVYAVKDTLTSSIQYFLFNLNNREEIFLLKIQTAETPSIFWSKNNSYVLLSWPPETPKIFSSSGASLIINSSAKNPHDFRWSNDSNATIYFWENNELHEFDLFLNNSKKIYSLPKSETLIDYFVANKTIYLIEQIGGKIFLTKQSLNAGDKQSVAKAIELKNANFKFERLYGNLLAFSDVKNQTLYLIDHDLNKIYFQKDNVQSADLNKNGRLLLLATNQELSYLDLSWTEPQEKIITRYSQGLKKAAWHLSNNYVFALRDGQIEAVELDDRGGHQTIPMAREQISSFNSDAKAEALFYLQDEKLKFLELN